MLVYSHPSCLLHDPGPGHPECPQRLQQVLDALHTAFPASWTGARRRRRSSAN